MAKWQRSWKSKPKSDSLVPIEEFTLPDPAIARDQIAKNLARISSDINGAAEQTGRDPSAVQLVAVTKYVDTSLTAAAIAAGCKILGENRPQSIWEKHSTLKSELETLGCTSVDFEFHLIGHLQRNKVRRSLPLVGMIQSIDSMRIADAIAEESARQERPINVLLEVNVTPDESKTGLLPDEAPAVLQKCLDSGSVTPVGLMGMARIASRDGDSDARRDFSAIREFRDRLESEMPNGHRLPVLSMGMSGDYLDAIAEGATMVRIGSALFDGLL